MKIADCDSCQFYAHNLHLVCAIHPSGVNDSSCLDYRPKVNQKSEEQWEPVGWKFTSDGDMERRFTYLVGDRPRTTPEQSWEILQTHPIFTERCPNCNYSFDMDNPPVYFDCPECGWIDDSI